MSISTVIFLFFLFFIANETKLFISKFAIWLSLIRYSSLRLNLWFVPPPNFTAYFCIILRFGIVFLVQQILHFLPTFFTNWFVFVAIPEIWDRKFNATLSPINIFFILPSMIAIKSPFLIVAPSFFFNLNLIFLSINLNVSFANSKPHTIPFWLEINFVFFLYYFLLGLM